MHPATLGGYDARCGPFRLCKEALLVRKVSTVPVNSFEGNISQSEVFEKERQIILERRRVAGLDAAQFKHGWFEQATAGGDASASDEVNGAAAQRPSVADVDPIGIALSGGGVRSAAFSLGIIQAFHRFGLMRYVDYLSAVSGGTYAAGMFVKSLPKNHSYSEHQCDLASERSGKSSEFVQRVSTRGNYLFRSDLFLARFIPGFLLNLAPQLCLLIAIGSGVALLWRSLDSHLVRDHLGAFGIDDLGTAFIPSLLLGILWLLSYIAGIVFASHPLKRASTWILTAAFVSVLIGMAVVIGNGDVTLNKGTYSLSGEETRIQWFNSLWKPLVSIVVLGCIPLLMPKKLLRSGTKPRGWFDSWVFYYVSLALFLGVPLVFIGYFAKEDISGYNTARKDAFLPGDLKDTRALKALVSEGSDVVFKFNDIPLAVSIDTEAIVFSKELKTKLAKLPSLLDSQQNLSVELRRAKTFPGIRSDGKNGEEVNNSSWLGVNYLRWLTPARDAMVALLTNSESNAYRKWITNQNERRKIERTFADELTSLAQSKPLFAFALAAPPQDNPNIITVAKISPELHQQLSTIAAVKDGKVPLSNELPISSYASLNRNIFESAFPQLIRERSELRRVNLIEKDQLHRLIWFVGSLVAAVVLSWCINPNQTGLHGYYRDRLAGTYLNRGKAQPEQVFPEIDRDFLSDVTPHLQGAAYPLFQASVITRQTWKHADQLAQPFQPFLLSPAFCGNSRLRYLVTPSLEKNQPTLADTIAISGGAIDPAFFVHHIMAFLVNAMNWRMGQLFPSPQASQWGRPTMLNQLLEYVRQTLRPSESRVPPNVLLTDGGHSENLGIEPLLCRRCRLIIVADAGYDPDHFLDDLAKVVHRLESTEGIRLVDVVPGQADASPADGQPLRIPGNMAEPVGSPNCDDAIRARNDSVGRLFRRLSQQAEKRHFFVAKVLYPECGTADSLGRSEHPEFEGRLIYIKPCLTGDEGLQLCNYAFRHAEFPHESTVDQAFDESQFEAYRRLGFHSGVDLCRDFPDPQGIDLKDQENSLWSRKKPWNLNELCEQLLGTDNFDERVRGNRIRKQIAGLIARYRQDSDDAQIVKDLEAFGNDLSIAADLFAEMPAPEGSIPLHAAVCEHLDQRAFEPLRKLLLKDGQGNDHSAAIERAIAWIDDLVRFGFPLQPDAIVDAVVEVARHTPEPAVGVAAVELLKSITEHTQVRKAVIKRALQKIVRSSKSDEIKQAAENAANAIRGDSPRQASGNAQNGHSHASELID